MRYALALVPGILCISTSVMIGAPPKTPEAVLTSLEEIYASRDYEAYAALLAPGYEFLSQQGNEMSREQELRGVQPLFQKAELQLKINRDFRLTNRSIK